MDKEVFAFIESNTTGTGKLFLEKALELGYEVYFLSQDPDRYPFLKTIEVHVRVVDTQDEMALINMLCHIANLKGVFSTSEYFIEITAKVAKNLNLPGNHPEAVQLCRNKKLFYERISQSLDLSVPQTWFIKHHEELNELENELIYPLVVKPVSGTGSMGVKKCHNFSELNSQFSHLLSIKNNERGAPIEGGVLIQNYVEGPEYSAEIVGCKGEFFLLGLTAKQTTDNDYFIETGHDFPAPLPDKIGALIWETLKKTLSFLGFSFGPAHIEFKLQGAQVILIEVNPRLAGGMIPQLVCYASEADLYASLIRLYAQQHVIFVTSQSKAASIRFFLAEKSGTLMSLAAEAVLRGLKNVVEVHVTKKIGDPIEIHHDFRDRIGCLITTGSNSLESRLYADAALKHVSMHIECNQNDGRGRLSEGPHPFLKQLMRKSRTDSKLQEELKYIAQIDLAHLLMLFKMKVINYGQTAPLISTILHFQTVGIHTLFLDLDFSRGVYYAYEHYLEKCLGVEISGNNHIARSRNDINAALFYLSCRHSFLKIYNKILELSERILHRAQTSKSILLPLYSQHQPAVPGSYAFYLLGIHEALTRFLKDLRDCEETMRSSPLGAGSGSGTDVLIDQEYVAHLLGFEGCFKNALDAIANRDLAIRYKSIIANLCLLLSRVAQDYQLWTTQEFHFFELPDNLCGSSSMMPQKKNPYLLEIIKSKTSDILSNLFNTFIKMQKVPMGNSIEVSSAAYDTLDAVTTECLECLDLLILVIDHASPISKNMESAHRKGLTIATYVANQMRISEKVSFRTAHHTIGQRIRLAGEGAFESLLSTLHLSDLNSDQVLTKITQSLEFGGGPGKASTELQLSLAFKNLEMARNWILEKQERWEQSQKDLNAAIEIFLNQTPSNLNPLCLNPS